MDDQRMTTHPLSPPQAPPAPGPTAARRRRRQLGTVLLPYGLLAPATIVLGLILVYPLIRLIMFSVQKFGLRQQFGAPPEFVGLENYRRVLTDPQFWTVLGRTVAFCAETVVLTMTIGMIVALITQRVGRALRLAIITSLLLAWAMPPLSSTIVWQWMFDTQFGLVNWLLTTLGLDYDAHSWLSDPLSFYFVATLVVVWMGVPFIAFTLYAGLTQVPQELIEAAQLDGANGFQRFRHVIVPVLKPILLILTALSVLWNFRIFTQIYVLQKAGGVNRDTNVLGLYTYRIAIGESRFDVGAALAVLMVIILLLFSIFYLRQTAKTEEL
jgi:N,N'-diacetylchitobiose transport system permease protein